MCSCHLLLPLFNVPSGFVPFNWFLPFVWPRWPLPVACSPVVSLLGRLFFQQTKATPTTMFTQANAAHNSSEAHTNPIQNICTQCQLSSLLLHNKEQVRYTQIELTKYRALLLLSFGIGTNMRRNSIACNKRPIDFLPNNEIGFVITPTAHSLCCTHNTRARAEHTMSAHSGESN